MLTAITGINWGDEGKGRMVDLISQEYDIVARYQGGNNAGHTVKNERGKFVLNLLPSGILRPNVVCVMGNGMVIDPHHLDGEINKLREQGVEISPANLKISDRATITMPYHVEQDGLEEERYLYRNTVDDGNVLVDYGFEGLTCTNTFEYENGISKSFGNYALNTAPDAENLFFGNVYGASEHFWSDMMIYDGETDPNVLKQKMLTGEYVIIGDRLDRLSGGPKTTSLSEQLQIGDSISFYRDGELVKTCTILAKACVA